MKQLYRRTLSIKRDQLRKNEILTNPQFQQDMADFVKKFPFSRSNKEASNLANTDFYYRKYKTANQIRKKWGLSPEAQIPPLEVNGQKLLSVNSISVKCNGSGIRRGNKFEYDHIYVRIGREATYQELLNSLPYIWKIKEHKCGKPSFKPKWGTFSNQHEKRKRKTKALHKYVRTKYVKMSKRYKDNWEPIPTESIITDLENSVMEKFDERRSRKTLKRFAHTKSKKSG